MPNNSYNSPLNKSTTLKNGIVYILLFRWNYSWIKWKQKNKCWFD